MEIDTYADLFVKFCRDPGTIVHLADQLKLEYGKKWSPQISKQCRVRLKYGMATPQLSFILRTILFDAGATTQTILAHVMDLTAGHTLTLELRLNYAYMLSPYQDHGLIIEES